MSFSLSVKFVAYSATMRIIRRYSNRKLYDTQESHYVTLSQVAGLVRNGEEIRVIAKDTNNDLTAATLALIIFEEEKRGPRLPVSGLRRIIQTGVI
jgi:polyhydroxyalkanoate synthesis repressor PhaR